MRALLAELIDYAGLFPPAALPLADACTNYDVYRHSAHAWALGRMVVPVTRLSAVADRVAAHSSDPWRVSAIVGDDVECDAEIIRAVNARGRLAIETAEVRTQSAATIVTTVKALDSSLSVYLEIPVAGDPSLLVEAIAQSGARAKIRMGGLTPAAFPTAAQSARFIACCAEYDVAFKATAGLHHPLGGDYRLTDADDAPRARMFGFLNMFVAAAFARQGMTELVMAELLAEREATAFCFSDDAIRWRDHSLALDDVIAARSSFAIAFGSCSFREPMDDLHQLGLL